jgi:hypothetical protein
VFLIDSESRLRAGGAAASHAGHAPAPADAQESPPPDSAPAPDHSGH